MATKKTTKKKITKKKTISVQEFEKVNAKLIEISKSVQEFEEVNAKLIEISKSRAAIIERNKEMQTEIAKKTDRIKKLENFILEHSDKFEPDVDNTPWYKRLFMRG